MKQKTGEVSKDKTSVDGNNSAVVILIHGTYSYEEEDAGTKWWQRGSIFWNKLKNSLPSGIYLLESEPIFKWNGLNNYMSRYVAGVELLDYIEKLESKRVPYHIVAHSHGGTVLWNALRVAYWSAKKRRKGDDEKECCFNLPHLRSCTAIATPFIRFKNLQNGKLSIWFAELQSIFISFILPISIVILLWAYMSYWALLALILIFVFAPFGERVSFPVKFAAMQDLDTQIAYALGERWLSLWSDDDEAINLLRAAQSIQIAAVKPPLPIVPREHSNLFVKTIFYGNTIFIYLFDRYVIPYLNRIVSNRLAAFSLGLPFVTKVDDVLPIPSNEIYKHPKLSKTTQEEIKKAADNYLSGATPALREKFIRALQAKEPNPLEIISLSDRELVHTSYFYNDSFVQRIVDHISETS